MSNTGRVTPSPYQYSPSGQSPYMSVLGGALGTFAQNYAAMKGKQQGQAGQQGPAGPDMSSMLAQRLGSLFTNTNSNQPVANTPNAFTTPVNSPQVSARYFD